MDNVIMAGVKIDSEVAKGGGTLWSLSDGTYAIKIINKREAFKNKKEAVVTTLGISTIASLFAQATVEVINDHTAASGDFQFNPEWLLEAQIEKGEVRKLSKMEAKAAKKTKTTQEYNQATDANLFTWDPAKNIFVEN
jgi:hypothetical protein